MVGYSYGFCSQPKRALAEGRIDLLRHDAHPSETMQQKRSAFRKGEDAARRYS
jgi:hypothetical protein